MSTIDIQGILGSGNDDSRLHGISKTKIICTLGPKSRDVSVLEKLLKAGMNVARFNFSHGTYEYHSGTLENLKQAMYNTQIMCGVLLDTKVQRHTQHLLPIQQTGARGLKFLYDCLPMYLSRLFSVDSPLTNPLGRGGNLSPKYPSQDSDLSTPTPLSKWLS